MANDPPNEPEKPQDEIARSIETAEVVAQPSDSESAPASSFGIVGDAFDQFFESPQEQPKEPSKKKPREKKPRRPRQRDLFLPLIEGLETWCAPSREAFVSIPAGAGVINWPVRSQVFKGWLAGRAYESVGAVPGTQALDDICRIIEARAVKEGKKQTPWLRVGRRGDLACIDLCDDLGRIVEIYPDDCEIVENRDLPFVRSEHMAAQCEPEFDGAIEEFRGFVNASDDDFVLLVAWMIGALRGSGPYPILIIAGEHGSGKSALSFRVRSLVDPNLVETQSPPKDERDLIVAAQSWHLLFFENVSHLTADLSDAFCRVSTGGGFATRALHTDRGLNVFSGSRPLALNGIDLSGARADFSDRAIIIHLRAIPDAERRPIADLDHDWQLARPRVLGALCTAISAALRNEKTVDLPAYTRMADFERWVVAAEPGLGWEPGTFLRAYRENRRDTANAAFDADTIAGPVRDFVEQENLTYWEGTATDLLAKLDCIVSEQRRGQRSWPKSGQALGAMIVRSAPLLREKNITVEKRHSGTRKIVIARSEAPAS